MSNFYHGKKGQDPLAAKAGTEERLKRAYQFLKGKEGSLQNSNLKADQKNPASQAPENSGGPSMEKQMEEFEVMNIRNGEVVINPEEVFEKQGSLIRGDPRFGIKTFVENIRIVEEEAGEEDEESAFERAVERLGPKDQQLAKLEHALKRDKISLEKEAGRDVDTDRELRLLKHDLKQGLSTEKRPTKKNLMLGHKTQWKAGIGYSS